MSKLDYLMIHCSQTPPGRNFTGKDIIEWHTVGRGWSRPGYSTIFRIDGTTEILIPFNNDDNVDSWEISNGAAGWNGRTRHICYIGGGSNSHPIDSRTPEQNAAMECFIRIHIMMWPNIKILGHNQVNQEKTCPSFNVPDWLQSIGIPVKNIDFNTYFK